MFLQPAEIDAAAVDARRRPGLQPALRQFQLLQAGRQAHRGWVARPACAVVLQAHVDAAIQEGAGRQYHRACPEAHTHLGDGAHHAVTLQHQVIHRLLEEPQPGLVLQPPADGRLVQHAVGLRPRCAHGRAAHGRALAAIEDAELDAGLVGGGRHRAAQGVHLLHQMALADAADAGVAAHLPKRLDVVRQQQRGAAHTCGGQRGLGAGMAATNDDHIKRLGVQHAAILRSAPGAAPADDRLPESRADRRARFRKPVRELPGRPRTCS